MVKKILKKGTKQAAKFTSQTGDKIFIAIATAFGLVIAFTWNEAIKEGVNKIISAMHLSGTAYIYKIITAIIITAICIFGIMLTSKLTRPKEQKK